MTKMELRPGRLPLLYCCDPNVGSPAMCEFDKAVRVTKPDMNLAALKNHSAQAMDRFALLSTIE